MDELPDVDDDRIASRAGDLQPEEEEAGSDDPKAQAEAILGESEARTLDREDPPHPVEHRQSDETVDPT